MQSYWTTTFSSARAKAAAEAVTEPTRRVMPSLRIMVVSPRGSELDLELVEHRGTPAGAGREGTVAAAVEMLADEVDLPARPAVEPDVGADGDGDDLAAVDGLQGVARELRHLGPHQRLDASLGLAPALPEGGLSIAAVELDVAVA